MSGIFIAYRRRDVSYIAGRLADELGAHFGREAVFRDIDSLRPGDDFTAAIKRAVAECDVMLVLIGDDWLTATGPRGRQMDDPSDLMRLEIATALKRNILVIPILVENARMPTAKELPRELQPLTRRNALVLTDLRWGNEIDQLIRALEVVVRRSAGAQDESSAQEAARGGPGANEQQLVAAVKALTPSASDSVRWALAVVRSLLGGRRLLVGLLLHDNAGQGPNFIRLVADHLLEVTGEPVADLLKSRFALTALPTTPRKAVTAPSLSAAGLDSLVTAAHGLATRAAPGGEVALRHLVAALFVHEPEALLQAGADLETLGKGLHDALRLYAPLDFAAWGDLLVPLDRSWLAGYAADTVVGADRLGVQADVDMLCSVLAAGPPVRPPLSVGLFGDWGSGKSFFMELMRKRIDELAAAAKDAQDDGRPTSYCTHVCQITFNAWHYADANLWASLVAEIFRQLAQRTEGETALAAKLEMASEQVQQAQARRTDAEAAVERLAGNIEALERERDASTNRLTGFAGDVAKGVRSDAGLRREVVALGKRAGVNAEDVRYARQIPWQARATLTAARRLWALQSPERRHRSTLTAAAAATAVAVSAFLAYLVAMSAESGLVRFATTLMPVVVAATGFVARTLNRTRKALTAALIERQLEVARKDKDEAEQAVAEAEAELAEVQAGRRLAHFIHERSRSGDYQQHLGLIALVRRDFERLSSLLVPDSDDGDGGRGEGVPEIDRIILYIDDLDRCPADRVVEVLQAVHLLLALPLFVVVVGVDSRWLLRSLQRHYATQLAVGDEWASGPQNYLEKIFQIPFALRPMGADSYRSLARSLLPASAPEPPPRREPAPQPRDEDVADVITGEPELTDAPTGAPAPSLRPEAPNPRARAWTSLPRV